MDNSYHKDRFLVRYVRNRPNRKEFFITGIYRGRYQRDYSGKVLLHRVIVNPGTQSRGKGSQFTINSLESILGKVASSSILTINKANNILLIKLFQYLNEPH